MTQEFNELTVLNALIVFEALKRKGLIDKYVERTIRMTDARMAGILEKKRR